MTTLKHAMALKRQAKSVHRAVTFNNRIHQPDNFSINLRYDPLIVEFDSLEEMIAASEATPEITYNAYRSSRRQTADTSFGEGIKIAKSGWSIGRDKIDGMAKAMRIKYERQSMTEHMRPQFVPSVAGPVCNVPAVLAGLPDSMFTWSNVPTGAEIVHIGFGNTVGGTQRAYELRGAVILAICDLLESMGKRVMLTWYRTIRGQAEIRLVLKHPDRPMNIESSVYMIAHMSSGTHVGWGAQETLPEPWQTEIGDMAHGGSGSEAYEPINMRELDIFIPAMNHTSDWDSEETALAYMEMVLNKNGIVVD